MLIRSLKSIRKWICLQRESTKSVETVFTGVYLWEWVSSNSQRQKISRTRKRGASANREWEIEEETEKGRHKQHRVDVQTELDTIRKSILRQWYAVKIILVSAMTRREYKERVETKRVNGKCEEEGDRREKGDETGFPDTKTVRFGISQNLRYACIRREQTRTVLSRVP